MSNKSLFLLAPIVAAWLAAAGCNENLQPEPASYAGHGPWAVGYRQLEAPGAMRVKSWYPALNPSAKKEEITYEIALKYVHWQTITPAFVQGHAIADAPIDPANGPYPLVVFSHGYAVSPEWYSVLVEHYASRGFIVLAPDHLETDWFRAVEAAFDRPNDVKRTLDFAEALAAPGGPLAGQIDMKNVALVGHSFGGYTALVAAGARFDLGPFNARCAALAVDDPKSFLCAPFLGREKDMATRAGLASVPDGLWPITMGDPRVTAIIPMAGDAFLLNESGLASITIPMMVIGGTEDIGTPWEWGAKPSYDHASSRRKSLVAFEGADHMIAANPCETMPFTAQLPDPEREIICADAPGWTRTRALAVIRHLSTAFLLDALKGDRGAHEALLPDAVNEVGLGYTTTMR